MEKVTEKYHLKLKELYYIFSRNVFLFTNGLIGCVIILLYIFGDNQSALFLAIVSVINILFGLIQEMYAWIKLEKLQLLTAPHVTRITENQTEEVVLADQIKKGDLIKLKIGEQVPCDSFLVEGQSFEINEGLITGESHSIAKKVNDDLLAGSVVTSGFGLIRTKSVFKESRIARMTEGIKKYSINLSPIQKAVNSFIRYCGYVSIIVIAYAVIRGFVVNEEYVQIVKNVGALTSALIPVGLFFATTLFFAYGAANLYRKYILLQEVNATEKLGRIKNLCMDKTGTLTENTLVVEDIFVPPQITVDKAQELTVAYIAGTGDSSQTINAVSKYIRFENKLKIVDSLSFSSWRRYGVAVVESEGISLAIWCGAPDLFLEHLNELDEIKWLRRFIDEVSKSGKHVWCVMKSSDSVIPSDMSKVKFSIVAVYVFYNNLREGIKHTINFFQKRSVKIRIISGDNAETVRTVAALSGVNNPDRIVTGNEIEHWTPKDYEEKVGDYTIFAKIFPEQKEKIIEAFKKDGFTAMVGDGANDALAIKKANLGIAMFDGAPATRQLAAIVLTNNSFSALPGGVTLADNIIRNLEIFASVFISQNFVGFMLFIIASILGYQFPLTPLNITLINYFTVGFPGILVSYWTIVALNKAKIPNGVPFLKRIFPFAVFSALAQAIFIGVVFVLSPEYLKLAQSNILVIAACSLTGYIFFVLTPYVYQGFVTLAQKIQMLVLGILEIIIFIVFLKIPFVVSFFDTTNLIPTFSMIDIIRIAAFFCLYVCIQYGLAKWFSLHTGKNDVV